MKVLSLDTTTRVGSVAIVEDDRVIEERAGDASRAHAERLPAEIVALLEAHRLRPSDVDVFAVASGPGSFTGLRIGIATIQGFAFVTRRRIVAVSALEALAQLAAAEGAPRASSPAYVGAWIDAHRRDVFSALYRVADAAPFTTERLIEMDGAAVGDPASTIARWQSLVADDPVTLTGDGAALFADLVVRDAPAWRRLAPAALAATIGRLALARARRGETLDPAGVHPLYVRRPDAELARERRVAD